MRAFKEIFLSQVRMFFRERVTLMITVILPLLLGIFLGIVFSGKSSREVRALVVDEDGSGTMALVIDGLIEGTVGTGLVVEKAEKKEALVQLEAGKVDSVLVFPKDSAISALGAGKTEVIVYFDPNRVTSSIARLIMETFVGELNFKVTKVERLFTVKEHAVGDKAIPLGNFFFPNTLAVSLLWMSLFATALPLVKQREKGALVQMKATPLSPITFMMGSILARLFIGLLQSGLFIAAGLIALELPVLDRLSLFIMAVIIGNLTLVFMGYMIASISRNMQSADAVSQVFNFGMMFLSGVFFTKEMLPDFFQKVSYAIPLTYMADLFRQLMTGYEGMFPIWLDFAVLAGFGILFAILSLWFFRLFSR